MEGLLSGGPTPTSFFMFIYLWFTCMSKAVSVFSVFVNLIVVVTVVLSVIIEFVLVVVLPSDGGGCGCFSYG